MDILAGYGIGSFFMTADQPPLSNRVALLGSLGQATVFLGIAAVVAWLSPINAFLHLQASMTGLVVGLALGGLLTASMAMLVYSPWGWLTPLKRDSRIEVAAMADLHPGSMLAIALGAGLSEEVLFRGVLQPALVSPLGLVGGLVVTSALFGLMHATSRAKAIECSIFGFLFGLIAWWSQGLFSAIVAHVTYDFAVMFLGVRILRYGLAPRSD